MSYSIFEFKEQLQSNLSAEDLAAGHAVDKARCKSLEVLLACLAQVILLGFLFLGFARCSQAHY